jgi:hypothetical protein
MAEPLTSTQLENATKMAAKVVETFGDDWRLRYDADFGEVSCRTEDHDTPIEDSFVEVFRTSQWLENRDHSPVAEFLCASIVMVPGLIGEVERLAADEAAHVEVLTQVSLAVSRWRQGDLDSFRALEAIEAAVAAPGDEVDDDIEGIAFGGTGDPGAAQAEQERAR